MFLERANEEWKEVWKPEYLKTVSAFYNTSGGKLIIGRRDDGVDVGVKNAKSTLKSISDSIQNKLNIHPDVDIEEHDGIAIIVIIVPAGKNKIDYDGQFFKRVGNTTQLIKGEELKDIIENERGTFWMDKSSGQRPESLSVDAIQRFVKMGKDIDRIPADVDSSDTEAVLDRYGLVCDDKTVTIAGLLLFSSHPRKFNRGTILKIGEFDLEGVLRREDIIDAPLIDIPNLAVDTLFNKYIPPTFQYEGALRKLVSVYPKEGIRELIVNAVVHTDYRFKEPVIVSVYPDKIEIFNFGGLPDGWTIETLVGRHRSIPRNKTLADVFHDAGYVENWAQGIRRVIESCEKNGNPKPKFILEHDGLSVSVSASTPHPLISINSTLTENQKLILECIVSDPSITQKKISEITGLAERTVTNNLSKLAQANIIFREGSKKRGKWIMVSTNPHTDSN